MCDVEVGAEEGGAQLRYEFLHGIGGIAKALTEISVEAVRNTAVVDEFMEQDGVVAFGW